jgi:hypothetical protein
MLPITSKFAKVLLSLHANAEIILTRVRAINMDVQLPHPQGRPLEMPRMVLAIKRKCETVSDNCIMPILESGWVWEIHPCLMVPFYMRIVTSFVEEIALYSPEKVKTGCTSSLRTRKKLVGIGLGEGGGIFWIVRLHLRWDKKKYLRSVSSEFCLKLTSWIKFAT